MNSPQTIPQPPQQRQFLADTLAGLSASPKRLPCKYFYDPAGLALFDQICELDEYYLTRAELEIMQRFAPEMAWQIGTGVCLIEYGSGSSVKTRILLDHLLSPIAYVPVEISRQHLMRVAKQIQFEYPSVEVLPVVADFTRPFEVADPTRTATRRVVYFPGSTIGNLEASDAERLLQEIASLCGCGGGLLIGIDLQKDKETLQRAYDDRSGVTAEFNLNLLHRLQNELNAQLDINGFQHHVIYNESRSRIEISLQSLRAQTIEVGDTMFSLEKHELIHTEYSHKYTVEQFRWLAEAAGFQLQKSWTDQQHRFAVLFFRVC